MVTMVELIIVKDSMRNHPAMKKKNKGVEIRK